MPKSKRAKVVTITKTSKKTRSDKDNLFKDVQESVEKWKYVWLFGVGDMRNAPLKDVRKAWKDTARIHFGRGVVMAKALGTSPETEHRPGLHGIAQRVRGQVGLFFTNSSPEEVTEWFDDFKVPSFARAKQVASKTVVIPEGPVMQHHSEPPEPFPHSMEPQLRKLGLSTRLEKGVPTLSVDQTVCKEGEVLNPEQTQILKLIGEKMAVFKVILKARWDSESGEVTVLVEDDLPLRGTKEDAEMNDEDDDEKGDDMEG